MDGEEDARPHLIAYAGSTSPLSPPIPAPRWRDWMDATEKRWANRCLPLLVANEAGWALLNPSAFTVTWNGGDQNDALEIEFEAGAPPKDNIVTSHFGYGVVTWSIPYLFRTPPGWNLLARGPANMPKDGICALEGVVETDWAVATFTMNWKLTRPDLPVRFDADEPFCMLIPQRRGELASFVPEVRDIRTDPETFEASKQLASARHELQVRKFLGGYSPAFADAKYEWERHYFKGLRPDGSSAEGHQTHLGLEAFADRRNEDEQAKRPGAETARRSGRS